MAEPLWKLTRSGVRWYWDEEFQQLLDKIKALVIEAVILIYY
jgi:hypothetical protein